MKLRVILSFFFFFVLLYSCTKNNSEDIKKMNTNTCDTMNVTYTVNIQPILQKYNCVSCHSPGTGSPLLSNYEEVEMNAAKILPAIKHDPGLPFTKRMPSGGGKLTDCEILIFEAWVNQGKAE